MDHRGHSELDILASFGFRVFGHELGPSALIGGHVPLFVTLEYEAEFIADLAPAPTQRRDWTTYSAAAFTEALMTFDWSQWDPGGCTSRMAEVLTAAVGQALDEVAPHVPISARARRMRAEPWRTGELEDREKEVTKMYKRFLRNRDLGLLALFKELRSRSVKLYSELLSSYVWDIVASCNLQTDIWRALGRVGVVKSKKCRCWCGPE